MTQAILFTGSTDFSITGTGQLYGLGGASCLHVTDPAATLNVSANLAGGAGSFVKSGAGVVNLNGAANQFGYSAAANVIALDGVLRATPTALGGSTSSGGAFTTILLGGGVLEINGGGTFSRALGAAASGTAAGGTITWFGDGGFSAVAGDSTVTLVSAIGGSTPVNLLWGTTSGFLPFANAFLFGSTKADSRIDFTNNIAFDNGAAGNGYGWMEFRVADNPNSATDVARLSGIISGSVNFDLAKTGAGTLELTNTNTYAGNTLIKGGTLAVANGAAIPDGGAVVLSNVAGAKLQLNSSETIGGLTGGGALGGDVALQNNTLTVGDQRDSTFGGKFTGAGGAVIKQGTGTLTLTGVSTHDGGTAVNAGKLAVNGQIGAVTVANGGTLGGTGTTGALTLQSGGTLAPGNSPGTLHTGSVSLAGGSTLAIEIASASSFDQLDVNGLVSLIGDVQFVLMLSYTPTVPDVFVIVNNDGNDAIDRLGNTTFLAVGANQLTEGGLFTAGGIDWTISYQGGTGNDVTLTAAPTPEPTSTVLLLAGLGVFAARRRRNFRTCALLALLAGSFAPAALHAAVVTGSFTGTVSASYAYTFQNGLTVPDPPSFINAGTPVTGLFSYEQLGAIDSNAAPDIGDYTVVGHLSIAANGFQTFESQGPLSIQITNGTGNDGFRIFNSFQPSSGGSFYAEFANTIFSSDALPESLAANSGLSGSPEVYALAVYSGGPLPLNGTAAGNSFNYTPTSVTATPEPSTALLLAGGGLAMLFQRQRKSRDLALSAC